MIFEPNIQLYLDDKGKHALEAAKNEFGLRINETDDLVQLNYSIDSVPGPETNECRGIILEKDTWDVVAYPFHRFFNYGDKEAHELSYPVSLIEKLDGTLMFVYRRKDRMFVATRGRILADGPIQSIVASDCSFKTYRQLFWFLAYEAGLDIDPSSWPDDDYIYMFELTSRWNRVVVPYESPDIYLIGVRDMVTGDELLTWEVEQLAYSMGVKTPEKIVEAHSLDDIEDQLAFLSELSMREGFIAVGDYLVNGNVPRVKFKLNKYVDAHKMVNNHNFSDKHIIRLINNGNAAELIFNFPEYEKRFEDIDTKIRCLLDRVVKDYDSAMDVASDTTTIKDNPDEHRRLFAAFAKTTPYPSALFGMYDGRLIGFRDENNRILGMSEEKLMSLL